MIVETKRLILRKITIEDAEFTPMLQHWGLHPHLGYMHVHNNHGEEDSHNPVMDGTIDFEQLFERLDKWQVAPIVTTEIYRQGLIESIDYLEKIMAVARCYGNT